MPEEVKFQNETKKPEEVKFQTESKKKDIPVIEKTIGDLGEHEHQP